MDSSRFFETGPVSLIAVALSAGLLCLSLAVPDAWLAGWVALWPVFWVLESRPSWKRRLALGAAWLFFISQFGFPYAVATAYRHLGGQNPLGAWLMGSFLGVATSLRYCLFLWLARDCPWRIPFWAGLWCFLELAVWQMMPVYGAVHVLGDRAFVQWAEIVGAPGLSWLWFGLSLMLYDGLRRRSLLRRGLVGLAVIHGLGFLMLKHWEGSIGQWPVHRVGLVQANQPPNLQLSQPEGQAALPRMLDLTGKFLALHNQPPEILVWPEASLPLVEHHRLGPIRPGCPLIFTDYEPGTQAGYVVARALDAQGRSVGSYRKRRLIMMGEWTPGDPAHSLQVGDRDQLLPGPFGPALPLVCFEGLFPSFVAAFHRHTGGAATWAVHMGSESSFSSPLACAQSLHLAQFRAIELRRPVVRADNSGVSGWIDPTGRLRQATPTFQAQSVMLELSVNPEPGITLYTLWGDYPLYALIGLGLALAWRSRPTGSQR